MTCMSTSRVQIRSVIQSNESHILEGALTIPASVRSTLSGFLTYLSNVDIDGHGTWEPIGGMGNRFLVRRTIYQIDMSHIYRVKDRSRGVLYGMDQGGSFLPSSVVEPYVPEAQRPQAAFKTALENLRVHGGWEPDTVIQEDWKDPPEIFPVWRPKKFDR